MTDTEKSLETLTTKLGEVLTKVEALEKSAPNADISKFTAEFDAMKADLAATKLAATDGAKGDLIANMAKDGLNPINPETSLAYTLADLQKMDVSLLKVLAVNSPKLPLGAKSNLKSEPDCNKPVIPEGAKGLEKTEAVWNQKYEALARQRQ